MNRQLTLSPDVKALRARPRSGVNVADEMRRLMPRDRWLIDLLGQHQVFTTAQVQTLAFGNLHTARNRLTLLNQRGLLARFRNAVRPGSEQWRWTVDLVGATWLAMRDGQAVPKFTTVHERINRLAASPKLTHLLAVNDLFVDLVGHQREHSGAQLSAWWSARQCQQVTGDLLRPDAHGTWTDNGRTVAFWFEQDNGSEPMHRVVAKLDNYLVLARETGRTEAVLFRFDTPGREESFHRKATGHPTTTGLLVATATMGLHPAGPVWQVARHDPRRYTLAELADLNGHHTAGG